jgi:cyclic pyranopterin phosphate synthase
MTLNRKVQVRFIEFMPVDDWDSWKKQFVSKSEMIQRIEASLGKLTPLHEEQKDGPAVLYQLDGAPGAVGFISAISEHFCATCNRVRLSADGKIKHCLFSESFIDFREALRNGCSDEEIEELFATVMETKPEGHNIDIGADSQKFIHSMINVGG